MRNPGVESKATDQKNSQPTRQNGHEMTDLEKLVAAMKADGVDVTEAQAQDIALGQADSVAEYLALYESLQAPDVEADPAKLSRKFSEPSALEVL